VTANTVVQFPVELQAGQANTYTFSYVRFLDNNGVLTAPDACTTFRDNTLSPTIGVEGEVGVATPWARAGSNEVWGASFGPNRITFTDVPRNKLSNVVIGVSCTHLGVTQERSVLLKVRGFDDTNNDPASMTFRALNPPPIDADDPTQSGVGKLHWTLKNDVGACQITEVSRGGDYTPAIRSWGGDDYIKANPGAPLGVTLAVEYPSRPGSSRYTFSMSCSNVAAPIERTIIAARRSSIITGNGNSTGKVLNYGGGTARF
jgi:hypothetical protein